MIAAIIFINPLQGVVIHKIGKGHNTMLVSPIYNNYIIFYIELILIFVH